MGQNWGCGPIRSNHGSPGLSLPRFPMSTAKASDSKRVSGHLSPSTARLPPVIFEVSTVNCPHLSINSVTPEYDSPTLPSLSPTYSHLISLLNLGILCCVPWWRAHPKSWRSITELCIMCIISRHNQPRLQPTSDRTTPCIASSLHRPVPPNGDHSYGQPGPLWPVLDPNP